MQIRVDTLVEQPLPAVWSGFTRSLFDRLSPPFPPVTVVRFDGCRRGDIVHLRLNFLLFRQDWISRIVDQQTGEAEIYFVDKGVQLPFFLKSWRHRHRLLRHPSGGTVIRDDITYTTPGRLVDYLIYPLMWAQFVYRKPIYRRVFAGRTAE